MVCHPKSTLDEYTDKQQYMVALDASFVTKFQDKKKNLQV